MKNWEEIIPGNGVVRIGQFAGIALLAASLAACSSSDSSDDLGDDGSNGDPDPGGFTISGEVSGLDTGGLTLVLNEEEELKVEEDGAFSFSEVLEDGEQYEVELLDSPASRLCELGNASGSVDSADVDDVQISCGPWNLTAFNDEEAIDVEWGAADGLDIHYSTERDCGWENVNQCANGGTVSENGGNATLTVEDDGLEADESYFFVATYGDQQSHIVSATPTTFHLTGPVNDVLLQSDRLIVGGEPARHGALTTSIAKFGQSDGAFRHTGEVLEFIRSSGAFPVAMDMVQAPDGGWYVSGMFDYVDGFSQSNLVRLNEDGSVDEDWSIDSQGVWIEIAHVDEDRLYLMGRFSISEEGEDYRSFVALNHDGTVDTTFQPEAPFEPSGGDRPEAFLIHEGTIYISGTFSNDADENEENIAALDEETGELIDGFNATLDGRGFGFLIHEEELIVGGEFTEVNGNNQAHLARLDPETGDLDSSFNPDFDGSVVALESVGLHILVGGGFDTINGSETENLALLNSASGAVNGEWTIHADGFVGEIAKSEDLIYVAGDFHVLGGEAQSTAGRINVSGGAYEVDSDWTLPVHGSARGVVPVEDGYFVHGAIRGAGGRSLGGLYALDIVDGRPAQEWEPEVASTVHAIAKGGSSIYAGGDFSIVAGEERSNAAAFDPSDASLLGWEPDTDGIVHDLKVSGSGVYIAGAFSEIRGENRQSLALVDEVSGSPMSSPSLDIDGEIRSISHMTQEDVFFIGGDFSSVNGTNRDNLAALNDQTFDLLGWAPDPNRFLNAVTFIDPDRVLIGGSFSNVTSETQQRFAMISESEEILGQPPRANNIVEAISHHKSQETVTIGGNFTEMGDDEVGHFGAYHLDPDDHTFTLKDNQPEFDNRVRTLDRSDSMIAVGGEFREVNDATNSGVILLHADTLELIWANDP